MVVLPPGNGGRTSEAVRGVDTRALACILDGVFRYALASRYVQFLGALNVANRAVRYTVTLPASLASDVAYVAGRMGITRSALVASLLEEPVAGMRAMLVQVPGKLADLSPSSVRRLRGESADLIRGAVQQASALADSLDEGSGHG